MVKSLADDFFSHNNMSKLEAIIKKSSKQACSTNFPRKSLYWAKKKAKQLASKKDHPNIKTKRLYDNMNIVYGFEESLNTGNFAPWPHEVKKETQCLIYAGCAYMTAKELGLDPRLFNVFGVRDSLSVKNKHGLAGDHAFIDVNTGAKTRVIVDKQTSMIGFANYNKEKRRIRIKDNPYTGSTVRHYDNLVELTPEQYVKKIQFLRTPPGSINMLEQGQIIDRYQIDKYFSCELGIKYSQENKEIEAHISMDIPLGANKLFIYKYMPGDDGKPLDERIEFAAYRESYWFQYKDRLNIGTYNLGTVRLIWDIFRNVIVTKDSKVSRHGNIESNKLKNHFIDKGVGDNLTVRNRQTLEKIVDIETVEKSFDAMDDEIELQYAKLSSQGDELFDHIIKSEAAYNKAKNKVIAAGEDNEGFIFTHEERKKYIFEQIDKWEKTETIEKDYFFRSLRANAERKETASYYTRKQKMKSRESNKIRDQVGTLYWIFKKMKGRYDMIADKQLFSEKNRKGNLPENISSLSEPDESEKYSAYRKIVFDYLINSYQMKDELTLKKYRKCLESKFKDYGAYRYIEQNIGEVEERCGKREADIFRGLLDISGELFVNKGDSLLYEGAAFLKDIMNS